MKDINELPDLMVELIEATDTTTGIPKFPKRATEIVKEISAYAQGTWMYRDLAAEKTDRFWPDSTKPEEIWAFILRKIIGAPTTLHRDASVLCHMPALEKALAAQRRCRVCGCTDNNACFPASCYWVEDDLCSECVGKEVHLNDHRRSDQ